MMGYCPTTINWDATNFVTTLTSVSLQRSADSFSAAAAPTHRSILDRCYVEDRDDIELTMSLMQLSEQSFSEMWNDPAEDVWDKV
jgi:hypothetical protein